MDTCRKGLDGIWFRGASQGWGSDMNPDGRKELGIAEALWVR